MNGIRELRHFEHNLDHSQDAIKRLLHASCTAMNAALQRASRFSEEERIFGHALRQLQHQPLVIHEQIATHCKVLPCGILGTPRLRYRWRSIITHAGGVPLVPPSTRIGNNQTGNI